MKGTVFEVPIWKEWCYEYNVNQARSNKPRGAYYNIIRKEWLNIDIQFESVDNPLDIVC